MAEQPPERGVTLFRPEALTGGQSQWLGSVIIAPSVSRRSFTAFAALGITALVSLLYFGEYTSRESVKGWVVPDRGLIRIYAPQSGVVGDVRVRDGAEVRQGQVLLVLSTEKQSESLGATQLEVSHQLRVRRDSLATERLLKLELQKKEIATLQGRLRSLILDREARVQELDAQRRRVELSTDTVQRLQPLLKQGVVAAIDVQRLEDERLDRLGRLKVLERERAIAAQERTTLEDELRSLPLKQRSELEELDRQTATLDQELAAAEAQRELVVVAPQAGTVTALQVGRGSGANSTAPLLSLIPAGSTLEAELFVPSRARGFIHAGQRVRLRYQAFPYQKFGLFVGTVTDISRSAVAPDELARERAVAIGPRETSESVYQVKVRLERQSVRAYDSEFPLQPGMQLDADIEIEHRRLVEWILDPIYSLTGRHQA